MEQVEPVPLPYEPRPKPKSLLKLKELRQSNHQRFIVAVINYFMPFFLTVVLPAIGRNITHSRLEIVGSVLLMLMGFLHVFELVRRYRLAASCWMARPGERRILKYNMRLRALGIRPPQRAYGSEISDQSPGHSSTKPVIPVKSLDLRQADRARRRRASGSTWLPVSSRLTQLFFLALLTVICIDYFKDFQPAQHPVSSAFGFLWIALFAVLAISLAFELSALCWRGCSAAGGSHAWQSWVGYWKRRIESFELSRTTASG